MTQRVCGMIVAVFLLVGVTSGWSQQYLYLPTPVSPGEKAEKEAGVLVQEISVRKGDTLYGISRAFSGRGSYYPQILLFNDIKNPDRIYPGNVLRIPVSRKSAADKAAEPGMRRQVSESPSAGAAADTAATAEKKREAASRTAATAPRTARAPKQPAAAPAGASAEQRLYERAIKAYRQDDFRTALELFDRFLTDYPASALAADASLYKAECYLKQSNQ